ncbi:MAG TPA: AAA family ATPase [Polyangiaceae bacterium]|nr:AAA family ATPase [Polyangiaceae bacterium]
MIIALIGCHGAGKTTLGRALEGILGWPFLDEIGARLAAQRRFRAEGVTAADAQEAFDEAVFLEETARDAAWDPRQHRIVETWHPGNLAYAAARSAMVVRRYLPRVVSMIARQPAMVIEVTAPPDVLAVRKSEAGDLAFFLEIGGAARDWASRLRLPTLARVLAHGRDATDIAAELAPELISAAASGHERIILSGGAR